MQYGDQLPYHSALEPDRFGVLVDLVMRADNAATARDADAYAALFTPARCQGLLLE